jgi:hypothetical protein
MLEITDKHFFLEIVADAIIQAHLQYRSEETRNRWINAIAKAASIIMEADLTFIHFDAEREILYFWSSASGEIYETTEECQCPAFRQAMPQPCYHRAMRRLVKNYFEYLKKPGEIHKIDFAEAVFFDPDLPVRRKIELLNLSIIEGRSELQPRVRALERFI